MAPTPAELQKLWPVPGQSLSQYTAHRWPGVTPESTATVRKYLERHYMEHHGMFNYTSRGAHNHTPFHLLVEWSLGGSPKHLDAIWDQHEDVERYAFESPGAITKDNVFDHLGDGDYYRAYLYFFSDLLLKQPISTVVEEYIFSPKANFEGKKPEMVNRLLDGIFHPMLYLGYGIEFSLPGLVAIGLTQTIVHGAPNPNLSPKSMLESTKRGAGTHAFTILSRIISDPAFANYKGSFDDLNKNLGSKIESYASEWLVDGSNEQEVVKKVQELSFMNVMIYVIGGWLDKGSRPGEFHKAEFTLMHLLTSSMTLTTYMAIPISAKSKSVILRAYFTRSLAYYINQGRPPLPIRSFFAAPVLTSFPGPSVRPTAAAHPSPSSPFAETPNIWLKIIQSALVHPDDHLSKVQRTLAHYDSLYGHIPAGEYSGTGLTGCEVIDGTLFVRTAALTMEWMGRIREGEPARFWGDDPNFPEAKIY